MPAYLLHLTSLARALGRGQASCLFSLREEEKDRGGEGGGGGRSKIVVQVRETCLEFVRNELFVGYQ